MPLSRATITYCKEVLVFMPAMLVIRTRPPAEAEIMVLVPVVKIEAGAISSNVKSVASLVSIGKVKAVAHDPPAAFAVASTPMYKLPSANVKATDDPNDARLFPEVPPLSAAVVTSIVVSATV